MSDRPVHDNMLRMNRQSVLARQDPERDMAYLLSYDMWNRYQIEGPQPESMHPLGIELGAPPRFMGHNVYTGATVPGTGILFLPEPTVRSMVGIWQTP